METTRILFIGNSFTNRNDLPGMLTRLAAAAKPSHRVETDRVIANGRALKTHWEHGDALAAIGSRKWTYVVLQEQSTLPLKNPARMHDVPLADRALVLLFDWWIINGDRQDGNPNLLWLQHDKRLHVIDHNLAFGDDPPDEFWARHLFRNDRPAMSALAAQMLPVMRNTITEFPILWQELPEQWTDRCILQSQRVDEILGRCLDGNFWALP